MEWPEVPVWPLAFGGMLLVGLALAWFMPDALWPAITLFPVAAIAALAAARPAAATALWLAALATCPEMWLGDLIGHASEIIGIDKGVGLALLIVCLLRYGARFDPCNPGLAFLFMFGAGFMHGVWPGLVMADSIRSLIGSAAPFAFSWSRLSAAWSRRVIGTVIASPFLIIGFGACLAAARLRPLYGVEDGALRLGASTHPAFLAGFTLISVYALLLEQVRGARGWRLLALGGDIMVLLATGARAPLGLALLLILLVAGAVPTQRWPWRARVPVLLAVAAAPAAAVLAAPFLGFVRLLSLASQGNVTDLSNRTLIWPIYEAAFWRSPWFGWGTGSGKVLVPVGTLLWKLLGTNAAHDEYLRIAVEGGGVGLGLLLLLMILWLRGAARGMRGAERSVMILVFLAFAVHSATDNTLIATTASLMFAWVSAVFARAEHEAALPAAV
ncbi:O-antigen ligase family protein [Acidisoma sp.]|uniref:O-antigen ligase family protein n=1 Tax=Acidisoma sp. TaxID=1872115 RepID=UPI003AFFD69E